MNAKTRTASLCLSLSLFAAVLSACSSGVASQSAASPSLSAAVSPYAASSPSPSADAENPEEAEPIAAPGFTLTDREGAEVSLSDYEGRVVVLNFWASWCPPCKEEMPDFQALYEKWAVLGEDAPVLLAINLADGYRGETVEQAKAFLAEQGYTFPVLFDETGAVASMYTNGSIPTTHILDQEGYVYASGVGMVSGQAVQDTVDQLMEERAQ